MKKILYSILPGLFLIGFNIGTGSVTAMAKAGANYGMSLLWALALSCLITYYLMLQYGKFTVVTGLTALQAFKKHIHPAVGLFFIIALGINVSGGIMGVMGIVNDVLHVFSKKYIEGGISALSWTGITSSIVYFLFLSGKTSRFEKILSVLVATMGLAFIINALLLGYPGSEIIKGLIPKVPKTANSNTGGSFLVVAGMVGTTISSMVFLIRTTLVKESKWTISQLNIQRRDAMVSATLMFLISAAIMLSSAAALHNNTGKLDNTSELISLLGLFAGGSGILLMVIGIVAAGLSSHLPNILLLPWLICDYFEIKRDMTKPGFRILVLIMSMLSFIVPLFHQRPVLVLILSQAFAALVLPATVACIFYLLNKKDLMGEYKASTADNIILTAIQIFAIIMGGVGLIGFWDMLSY